MPNLTNSLANGERVSDPMLDDMLHVGDAVLEQTCLSVSVSMLVVEPSLEYSLQMLMLESLFGKETIGIMLSVASSLSCSK